MGKRRFAIFILLGFILCNFGSNADPYDDSLRYFVRNTMEGFSSWISEEGLDPTPPIYNTFGMELSSGLFTLSGTVSNISVVGLSMNASYLYNADYDTSFTNTMINFHISVQGAGLSGYYNATGMVLGQYPIGDIGYWDMKSASFIIGFSEKFHLLNGFIQLNDSYWSTSESEIFFDGARDGIFDGMFDSDTYPYAEQILNGIADQMPSSVFGNVLLVYRHIFTYLQLIFAVTPVTDVINWTTTQHPSSIIPTQAPTTTIPTTTNTTRPSTAPPTTTTQSPCWDPVTISSEGMNNFLRWALNNYPSYLISNGLDPTSPIINQMNLNVNNSFLKLDGTFRNTAASNMSLGIEVESTSSEFVTPVFSLAVQFSSVSLHGTYSAVGDIISLYPIAGAGNWTIKNFRFGLEVTISGFAIIDGYINIREYSERRIRANHNLIEVGNHVQFPDLVTPESAEGLGLEVLAILGDVVPKMLEDEAKHPIINSVLDYLNFKFSNTPITEIIGTTGPPCRAT